MRFPNLPSGPSRAGCRLASLSLLLIAGALAANSETPLATSSVRFQTFDGTGPDKWASVWLLSTRYGSSAVQVLDDDDTLGLEAVAFDVPGHPLNRDASTSTYTRLLDHLRIDDPLYRAVGRIVDDLELNAWRSERDSMTLLVESGFRLMQQSNGRASVARHCYERFFTTVAGMLARRTLDETTMPADLVPSGDCRRAAPERSVPAAGLSSAVPELALADVLTAIREGRQIVFVDTRESAEFAEGHVPGAVNLKLREVSARAAEPLEGEDWVIAYCVKDFRGYEVARALRRHGVNAAIMNPYGLRGWIEAGLPVAGERGLSADAARERLLAIAESGS